MVTRATLLLVLVSTITLAQSSAPTAARVIEMIQQNLGIPWQEPTVDTFKSGDPNSPVVGIAVTMMSTLDVLQRAAAMGDNLIITHEPTFYGHTDSTVILAGEHDPVFEAKDAFIKEHHLIIWRFHDHWHRRRPDGIRTGIVHALGWEKYQNPGNDGVLTFPPMTLKELAAAFKKSLGIHVMRVLGDPSARVSKVALNEGFSGFESNRHAFQQEGVEVLVIGEAHEWETVEYAVDAIAEKKKTGLIILGHIPSEQAGMEECARWLKTFVKDVRIDFVPTSELSWNPE
jgi:putative NIF3 family GTP cyclohydrolase 1 type 2